MLCVTLGSTKDCIHYVSDYFNAKYDNSWFSSQLAKDIIKGIDDSDHIKDGYIESPVYDAISPRELSSGKNHYLQPYYGLTDMDISTVDSKIKIQHFLVENSSIER